MPRDLDPAGASARARDALHARARRLLPDEGASARLNQLAELATNILAVACAHVSLLTDVQTVVGVAGLPHTWLGDETQLSESLCAICARTGRPLVVNDAAQDERTRSLPIVLVEGAATFCAVPLVDNAGHTVGAVCLWDAAPRIWAQADVVNLQALARAVVGELELGALTREFDASRSRWNIAIEAAGIGSWDWNLRTGQLVWDRRLVEMFGYDGDEHFTESIEAFNARVHPDDVGQVTQALQRAMDTVGEYEAEYRVLLPGGGVRQIQARGRAEADSAGTPIRVAGAAWDVSSTRRDQNEAGNALEAMPVAYLAVDSDGRCLAVNGATEALLGRGRWQLVGLDVREVLAFGDASDADDALRAVGRDSAGRTVEVRLPGPVNRWVEIRMVPAAHGVTLFISDVNDRHQAQQLAAAAAEHDRGVAVALQRAMLTRLPEPDDLQIEARYLTAAALDQVGGDWYDAVIQGDRHTSITVGDVGGHDIEAASHMGQLRSMLRAFAWQHGTSPAQQLSALDGMMRTMRLGRLATCITARIEQSRQQEAAGLHTLRWSNAGNLPPLVVFPNGRVTLLERPVDLVLGVDPGCTRRDHTIDLPDFATVLLFTDGLVETRDDGLDDRLLELIDLVTRYAGEPLPDLLDAMLAGMVGEQGEDDVAILGTRFHPRAGAKPR